MPDLCKKLCRLAFSRTEKLPETHQTVEFQNGSVVFILTEIVHGLEPFEERKLGRMKDRLFDERGLGSTLTTLENFHSFRSPTSIGTIFLSPIFWALKAPGPARQFKGLFTLFFRAIIDQEPS